MNTQLEFFEARKQEAGHPLHRSVVEAFWYLEDIASQTVALQRTVKSLFDKGIPSLMEVNLEIAGFNENADDEASASTWLFRSVLDRFEIRNTKGRRKARFFCGLQYTIAPIDRSDELFVPHVALLVAPTDGSHEWEIDEFVLDDKHLSRQDPAEEIYAWRQAGPWRWVEDEDEAWSARVVPLAWLTDEAAVQTHLIGALLDEVGIFLRQAEAEKTD